MRKTSLLALVLLGIGLTSPSESADKRTSATTSGYPPVAVKGIAKPFVSVEIIPRVSGLIKAIHVGLGDKVTKGQLLVEIDDESYLSVVRKHAARVEKSRSLLNIIEAEIRRREDLLRRKLATREGMIDLVIAKDAAQGSYEEDRAELALAKQRLSRTKIMAPVDGFVSEIRFDTADFVERGTSGPLLTIIKYDPVRIVVQVDQITDLRFYKLILAGKDLKKEGVFALTLSDGEKYSHKGTFRGSSHRVDPDTGAIAYEFLFPNPDNLIVPGASVVLQLDALQ